MKCKRKQKTVQSTESMSLFSCTDKVPEFYIISLMNSSFASAYINTFVNTTVHCTTGDAKLLVVKIPTQQQLAACNSLFQKAYNLKKSVAQGKVAEVDIQAELQATEKQIDEFISNLYGING